MANLADALGRVSITVRIFGFCHLLVFLRIIEQLFHCCLNSLVIGTDDFLRAGGNPLGPFGSVAENQNRFV